MKLLANYKVRIFFILLISFSVSFFASRDLGLPGVFGGAFGFISFPLILLSVPLLFFKVLKRDIEIDELLSVYTFLWFF